MKGKTLYLCAYIWLLIPCCIFLAGWFKPWIAAIAIA